MTVNGMGDDTLSTTAQTLTSAINELDSGKQDIITGAATTITSNNLTANKVIISNNDGKIDVSNVTSDELGYLSGVTSAVQTQINSKQDELVSGTNIKTLDGNDILGAGNLELSTYLPFSSTWIIDSTTIAFCDIVNDDTNATVGKAYLGSVTFTDKPFSGNGELVVEILQGPNAGTKAIHLVLTSGNVAPYRWEYTYWKINDTANTSGWIGYQTELTFDNTPTQNSDNPVKSGGVYSAIEDRVVMTIHR